MNERLEKKLKKILAKAGLDEEEIGKIVDEVEGVVSEEVNEEEGNPEETPLPPSEESSEGEVPNPEEVAAPIEETPIPPQEEEPAPQAEEVPPSDGDIASALDELAAQEEGAIPPEAEVPPAPQEPLVPQFDPALVQELQSALGEANKTIEALTARIDSLEEALKGAGVITGSSQLGDETPRITPNANADQIDAFDDVLNVINGR